MFSLRPTRSLAALTVVVGVLAVAGPAGASSLHTGAHSIVTDNKDLCARVFSGDAYDNEMGIIGRSPDGIIAVLIGL
jgi:hypothetical protein